MLPVLLAAGATLSAQHLVVYDPIGPGFLDMPAPSLVFPAPAPPMFVYPAVPPLPPLPAGPPVFLPPGDSTIDATTGANWYTDGAVVAVTPTVAYAPAAPVPPPFPIGLVPPLVGPVTGMALDPVGGILWLTDGLTVVGAAPVPGTPFVTPPFPAPAPLVGLEWDGLTGTLLAVDLPGMVFTLTPAGALVGPPLPPVPVPGIASDVAIDKTGLAGIAGVRSIYVLAGPMIADVTSGLVMPGGTPVAAGLAFHAYPARVPPLGVCPCPGFAHAVATTGPMTTGNLGFGLSITGLPPGQLALFAFDFVWTPALPPINVLGCGFGLVIGSPTLVSGVVFANALGTSTFPLALPVPGGFGPIFHQSGTLCPADPVGIIVNPLAQITVCGT
jgi:hypothetical protein